LSARGPVQFLVAAGLASASLAALVLVVTGGDLTVSAGVELELTGRSAAVLFAVTALGLVVVAFTSRYCLDDPAPGRLLWLMVGTIVGAGVVAAAADVATLLAGWVATTIFLAALLFHRRDLGVVKDSRARTGSVLVATDTMLLAAAAIVLAEAGNVKLDQLGTVADRLASASVLGIDAATLAALLIVGAAAGRCAQIPFGAWLPTTLAAPTPVSALLHAGVVNGGALLLIGLAPLVFTQDAAVWALFAIASVTMLWATGQMIARPDVKGGLMLSTRGQMAFMLLQCAIGAFAAAIFHLIAHGMYKAYLFFASGNAIAEQRHLATAPGSAIPPAQGRRAVQQAVIALVAPAVALAAATVALAPSLPEDSSGLILLLFAFATGAQLTWWWQRFREPHGRTLYVGVLTLLLGAAAYVALLEQAKALFSIDPVASPVPAAALLPVLVLAASATCLKWLVAAGVDIGARHAWIRQFQRRVYAIALSGGTWAPRPRRRPASAAETERLEPARSLLQARS
jgi:NAD(P)H-quinone oxidoreductase subunit 5